ncbi:MAG: K(+)-transporting ATPase subunit C [Deltaproteobacteria bacterium]|nr:K(+)-transporting ATPase subunit C [Deltaproteobacteria bacterium]
MKTKAFIKELKLAMMTTLTLAILLCGVYPALVWGIAQIGFPFRSNGSLVLQDGHVLGSRLIAQGFTGQQYFHPRPSAAGDGYDAANSGASNLGPLSQKLVDQVKERVTAYRAENSLALSVKIPADAVTASASGLDPHISVRNAELQSARIAGVRGISEAAVQNLIRSHTDGPDLGFLGEPGVNVFELNLALDASKE